ncbi:MFS transporter [Pseudomaricurvus sp. HS19]|uniref:MFS transporter n=1 Tax=Pseudomaricurvus sp. HS19 TaxID=2692626 RepID=UPI00136C00C8|nr:MFS transporter [Pseudomaricurvus sp. HS19]MYM64788.1 MFS transporter [Pseudomaricurvus sp. HS19]
MRAEVNSSGAAASISHSYGVAWYTTILMAVLYWLSILDRFIISLLVDPIKQDLGISDVQFGMLHGLAFAVTFSIFGLLAGILADRYSRRVIIWCSVTVWSLSTALCGAAHSFWQLMLARVGVGAGEAGLNPAATSMITDLFPKERLTSAMAVYSLGASVGSGCAYLFGGLLITSVAAAESVALPLIGEVKPWQMVFFIIGLPGVLIALLSFTVPEPVRTGEVRAVKAGEKLNILSGYGELIRFMKSKRAFFITHYLGFGLASIVFSGCGAWYPAHIGRTFGWDAAQIGLALGVMLVGAGIIGKLLCGFCVDWLYRRGYRDAQFRWYAGCLLVAMPAGALATSSNNPWVFFAGMTLFLMLLSPLAAVYISSLNLVTPNKLRGAGVAFYSTTVGLVALSLGPFLVAAISDYVFGGNAIGLGMASMMLLFCPVAAVLLFLGMKAMRASVLE